MLLWSSPKTENRTGGYHIAFGVDETLGDAWDQIATCGVEVEDEEGVASSLSNLFREALSIS